jgi:hypothetical protein
MARYGQTRGLTSVRSVMHGRRELAVSAYARRQQRWRVIVACLGLVLIAAAAALYFVLQPREPVDPRRPHGVAVECVKCGQRGVIQVGTAANVFPTECPRCHERACHRLWECRACGQQFLNKDGGTLVRCPNPACRSLDVGTAQQLRPGSAEKSGNNGPD